jgi:hypothetical protein
MEACRDFGLSKDCRKGSSILNVTAIFGQIGRPKTIGSRRPNGPYLYQNIGKWAAIFALPMFNCHVGQGLKVISVTQFGSVGTGLLNMEESGEPWKSILPLPNGSRMNWNDRTQVGS